MIEIYEGDTLILTIDNDDGTDLTDSTVTVDYTGGTKTEGAGVTVTDNNDLEVLFDENDTAGRGGDYIHYIARVVDGNGYRSTWKKGKIKVLSAEV